MPHLAGLTKLTLETAPSVCHECVWWQSRGRRSPDKDRWMEKVELEFKPDAIDELADMPATMKPDEVKLAKQVIGTFEGDVDLEEYRDEYQTGLREIIDAKIEGREIVAPEVEAPPKVVNLMDALRKSLDSISASKKKPAAPAPTGMAAAPKKRARA